MNSPSGQMGNPHFPPGRTTAAGGSRSPFYSLPSVASIQDMLAYDPATGELFWRRDVHRGPRAGWVAGALDDQGYLVVTIRRRKYKGHRLAWVIMTGSWPTSAIDHQNRNRADNRWVNLRAASKAENNANSTVRASSRTGVKCVQDRGRRGFQAYISVGGRKRHLGYFPSVETASSAYLVAAENQFGEYARVK